MFDLLMCVCERETGSREVVLMEQVGMKPRKELWLSQREKKRTKAG